LAEHPGSTFVRRPFGAPSSELRQQAPPKGAEAVSLALLQEAQKINSLWEELVRLQRVAVSDRSFFVEART